MWAIGGSYSRTVKENVAGSEVAMRCSTLFNRDLRGQGKPPEFPTTARLTWRIPFVRRVAFCLLRHVAGAFHRRIRPRRVCAGAVLVCSWLEDPQFVAWDDGFAEPLVPCPRNPTPSASFGNKYINQVYENKNAPKLNIPMPVFSVKHAWYPLVSL